MNKMNKLELFLTPTFVPVYTYASYLQRALNNLLFRIKPKHW